LFWVYQFQRGWEHWYEITFIPVALYGGAIVLWFVGKMVEKTALSKKKNN